MTVASRRSADLLLDIGAWLTPGEDRRTPLVIVSVVHLDDEERSVFLGLLFECRRTRPIRR